uniref:Prostaglandin D2 receptor n=1 Tax=Buteo japonicus TaxID=224669 RepID=A0A8C0AXJ5_9AVES
MVPLCQDPAPSPSFGVCNPQHIRAYMGAFAADFNEDADLSALRFLSVNSIVDPWVFIIFRTSVFRTFVRRLCRRLNSRKMATCPAVIILIWYLQ